MKFIMRGLLGNSRFYILLFSGVLALGFYFYISSSIRSEQLQIIRLTQWYALTAVSCLYIALLVGPISRFINGPFIQKWLYARRAIGVSSFFFALLHASFAFFGQLGGFPGLPFLSNYYLLGISYSFIALVILMLMALTSFDFVVKKIKFKKWKMIHRLVYVAGILILVHALMLGTHFHDLSAFIPTILFTAVTFLFLLHALCLEKKYANYFSIFKFGMLSIFVLLGMSWFYLNYMNPIRQSGGSSFSVHSQHTSINNSNENVGIQQGLYMPGMEGDRSKRYTLQFLHDENIIANEETLLSFKITDAANGDSVFYFQTPYEKPFHLIVVSDDFSYFDHIHPTQKENTFSITHKFPKEGSYRLYADFQPFGAIEQQYGFHLNVGAVGGIAESSPEYSLVKDADNYKVELDYEGPLTSKALTNGSQKFTFTIKDQNGNPVTRLQPYLGAFGHLVMIRKDSYDYVHVHPVITKRVLPTDLSGPTVEFIPMAIYGEVKPGIYKVFGQFNPEGKLITVDYWVEVQ